jgi:hypothetical protein
VKTSELKELVTNYIADGGDPRFPPPELTSTVPAMLAQRAKEGPDPEGVATKLRRERDEAREERERLREDLRRSHESDRASWILIEAVAHAYNCSNFTTVPQEALDRLYIHYARGTGEWKDYRRAGRPMPEDVN